MNVKKMNVGIIFGGKSAEHEISLRSARSILAVIDRKKYRPVLIGIGKTGHWHLYDEQQFLRDGDDAARIRLAEPGDAVALTPQSQGRITNLTRQDFNEHIDVVFPVLHGPLGEDGTIQGLLKLADIPFVGSDVLAGAVGMNKDVMKRLLVEAGIPTVKAVRLQAGDSMPTYSSLVAQLGEPFFIKPSGLGSSVGVAKVSDASEYAEALVRAFDYDNTVLIESFVNGRELECAVIGNRHPMASVPGEIVSKDFYSYQAKYLDGKQATLQIPAKIPLKLAGRMQQMAVDAFQALCCKGLARVDFFLRDDGEILVNEVNTMPGFTNISMFPRLMQASGICYSALINRLILLALERFDYDKRPRTLYQTA